MRNRSTRAAAEWEENGMQSPIFWCPIATYCHLEQIHNTLYVNNIQGQGSRGDSFSAQKRLSILVICVHVKKTL